MKRKTSVIKDFFDYYKEMPNTSRLTDMIKAIPFILGVAIALILRKYFNII